MKLRFALFATGILLAAAQCASAATLQGVVLSGAQPQVYAKVTVYCAQAAAAVQVGYGEADGSGRFVVTVTPDACDGIFYAVAAGQTESRKTMATVIGPAINGGITINELTTVATAYAMAQFFNADGRVVGKALPLQVAAGFATELVDPATGAVSTVIQNPPNANQTNTWQELGTLANMLAACIDFSDVLCNELFTWSGTNPPGPVTTLQAMINIAHHPARNVVQLFALSEARGIYTPNLPASVVDPKTENLFRLDAFTVAIKFNATGAVDADGHEECPFGGPGNLAFDERGYAWIAINTIQGQPVSAHCQVVLKPNGQPADGSAGTPRSPLHGGGLLGQGYGIGLDPNGHVWSGNFGWGGDNPKTQSGSPGGSVSEFTLQGQPLSPDVYGYIGQLYRVQGLASDKLGNIWMASWGDDVVEVFPQGNPNPPFIFSNEANTKPFDVGIDNNNAAWVSNEGTSTVAKFTLAGNQLAKQFEVPVCNLRFEICLGDQPGTPKDVHPKGLAVDKENNGWVVASAADAIAAFDPNGNVLGLFSDNGQSIVRPWGVAVDSRDHVWVANFGNIVQAQEKYDIAELCGYAREDCGSIGQLLTPGTGYTLPSGGSPVLLHNGDPLYGKGSQIQSFKPLMRMTAVVIDMAGNIWAINNWKPEIINNTLLQNPGGDGIVIFIGLAAPVKPVPYSAPPQAP
jgi:hypothetical protein